MQPTVYSFISPRRRDGHRNGTRMEASEKGCDEGETRRINDEDPATLPDKTRSGNLAGNNFNAIVQFSPCPSIAAAFINSAWIIGIKTKGLIRRTMGSDILKSM
jgi:hypothetical protein